MKSLTPQRTKSASRFGIRALVVLAVFLLSTIVQTLSPVPASAAAADDILRANQRYYSSIFLRDCLYQLEHHNGWNGIIESGKTENGSMFDIGTPVFTVNIGRTLDPDDGVMQCNDKAAVTSALSTLSIGGSGMLLMLGYSRAEQVETVCVATTGQYNQCTRTEQRTIVTYKGPGTNDYNRIIQSTVSQDNVGRYMAYLNTFNSQCSLVEPPTGSGTEVTYKKVVLGENGEYSAVDTKAEFAIRKASVGYQSNQQYDKSDADTVITNYDYNKDDISCRDLLSEIDKLSGSAVTFNNNNKDDPLSTGTGAGDTTTKPDEEGESEPVCTGGSLGWILCPLTTLATEAINALAGSMEGFMRFDPLIGSTQGAAVESLWRIVVGIANLLLVIAFMIIIFSQATSVGLSAYGVKKMLPRIIGAAILINLSFYICALMVDITNVIGASIQGIINGASASIGQGTAADAPSFGAAIAQLALPVGALTIGAAYVGAIAFIVPVLLTGLISLLAIFVVLALRHVLTILLIIIAPLAFAAMILPNTDSLFKKWWKALYISLALYPIIMVLAYGSQLVSKVILAVAPTKGDEAWIWEIFAFIVIFAWIWALKTVVSLGGGLVGKLAGRINDPTKGLIDRSRNWAKQKQQNSTFGAIMNARKNAVNTNAQRRSYERMSRGAWGAVSSAGMMGETKQLMDTQIEDANSKIHDSRVKYSLGSISKEYDAKERDLNSDRGIVALAKAAQSAAARKDQVAFDALASHAASGGADEYKYFHELLQGRPTGEFERLGDSLRVGNKDVFDRSMRYLYSTKAGELGPKNPSLVNILQRGDSSIEKGSIDREMESGNMIKMYQKVGADKHAQYSSDQAKVAAKYATDAVIKELIENPGGKHSLGDTARKAYQAEYDAMTRGSGRSNPNGEPPVPPANQDTLPGL